MARDEDKLPIDRAVELERARRLGDRFDGGEDGSGELAREQRARRLSAEFLNHVSLGSLLGRATQGIAQLEESLELQRQKQLKALAAETFVEAPPVAPSPLERNLKRTLDDVTVKNVLDFRNTTGLSAEATATSAVCAVANLDDTVQMSIHSLNPDKPWEGAMEVLNKPGHFINTLRRFPQAVFAKKVSEENIVAARHFLQMARRGAEEAPPAVAAVQRWIAAAIHLWEAPVQKPVATPQRVEVNCKMRDYKPLRPNGEARPLRTDRPTLLSPRVPMVQPAAAKAAGRSIPVRQVGSVAAPPGAPRRMAMGQGESCGLRSSKSQDVRPATARAASPAQPRQVSPRPAPRRTGQSLTAPAGTPAAVTPTPPAPAARGVRERSLGSSQRNLARPQTARAARPQSARRTQTPTVRPQSVRRSDGDTLGRSQSRVSPRPTRSSSTTLSSRGGTLGTSKSASQLVRTGSGTPGSPATAMDLPSVEELKRMIAETKKEVREIRAVESKTKWQVNREERKDKLAQTIATQSELREWRWKQAEGMKALAVQRAQEAKVNDLQESKDFLKFKREAKLRTKEEELQLQTEVYHDRKKDSAWNVARAQEAVEQEQALVREKVDHVQHLREEKKQRVEQEKVSTAQERALQEHLDVAHLARQLAAEKERLLENLQFSRSCLQAPLRRR